MWSPLVDALYIPWIGRRKTWILPLQMIIATFLFLSSWFFCFLFFVFCFLFFVFCLFICLFCFVLLFCVSNQPRIGDYMDEIVDHDGAPDISFLSAAFFALVFFTGFPFIPSPSILHFTLLNQLNENDINSIPSK